MPSLLIPNPYIYRLIMNYEIKQRPAFITLLLNALSKQKKKSFLNLNMGMGGQCALSYCTVASLEVKREMNYERLNGADQFTAA